MVYFFFLVGCKDKPDVEPQDLIPYQHRRSGLWGYRIRGTKKIAIKPAFDEVTDFSGMPPSFNGFNLRTSKTRAEKRTSTGEVAFVKVNEKWGFINAKGEMVTSPRFDRIGEFSNGTVWVRSKGDNSVFLMDDTGKPLKSLIYDYVGFFRDGLCRVKKEGLFGFVDKTGKVVIPFIYDEAYSFSEGLCAVRKYGKWGCIDRTGSIVF